jgi:hypothetical protein
MNPVQQISPAMPVCPCLKETAVFIFKRVVAHPIEREARLHKLLRPEGLGYEDENRHYQKTRRDGRTVYEFNFAESDKTPTLYVPKMAV